MAFGMSKAGEGQPVVCATTLMIKPERVSPRKCACHCCIDEKRERGSQTGHGQPILAGCFKLGKICFPHVLIARERETTIGTTIQPAAKHLLARLVFEKL